MSTIDPATTTMVVAWWGAILSSIVFIWDIIKWRKIGPRLRFSVQTGMQTINVPEYEGKTILSFNAVNFGDRPTTLTNLCYAYYPSWWSRIRDKPKRNFVVVNPSRPQPFPFELKPGTVWMGMSEQTADVEEMAKSGHFVCLLFHSHTNKPLKQRLVIRQAVAI